MNLVSSFQINTDPHQKTRNKLLPLQIYTNLQQALPPETDQGTQPQDRPSLNHSSNDINKGVHPGQQQRCRERSHPESTSQGLRHRGRRHGDRFPLAKPEKTPGRKGQVELKSCRKWEEVQGPTWDVPSFTKPTGDLSPNWGTRHRTLTRPETQILAGI